MTNARENGVRPGIEILLRPIFGQNLCGGTTRWRAVPLVVPPTGTEIGKYDYYSDALDSAQYLCGAYETPVVVIIRK